MVDVPYWLLLTLISAVLNLAPFMAIFGWLAAVVLSAFDHIAGTAEASLLGMMIWPTVVYFVAQGFDGWVVEPLVQGQATELDPLTVLLAVMVGGVLAGVLGLLLAIPLTACAKILAEEVVLPRIKSYADEN